MQFMFGFGVAITFAATVPMLGCYRRLHTSIKLPIRIVFLITGLSPALGEQGLAYSSTDLRIHLFVQGWNLGGYSCLGLCCCTGLTQNSLFC